MFEFDKSGFSFLIKFILITAMVFASANFFSKNVYKESNLASLTDIRQTNREDKNTSIRIGFVGDIMLDRGVEAQIFRRGGGSYKYPFEKIAEELKSYDILFGNLEGPISNKGRDHGSLYSFRFKPKAVAGLAYAGFDILSLSNNHIGDWGEEALEDTSDNLKSSGILYVGAGKNKEEAENFKLITLGDTKISFLSFSEHAGSYKISENGKMAMINDKFAEKIKNAKTNSDIVVVHFHYGEEYVKAPTEFQIKTSRAAIDAGASLVVGTHPHVVLPLEEYNGGYIAYSLGNFVFDQNFSEETMEGSLLEAEIKNKNIIGINLRRVLINDYFQPILDTN